MFNVSMRPVNLIKCRIEICFAIVEFWHESRKYIHDGKTKENRLVVICNINGRYSRRKTIITGFCR